MPADDVEARLAALEARLDALSRELAVEDPLVRFGIELRRVTHELVRHDAAGGPRPRGACPRV